MPGCRSSHRETEHPRNHPAQGEQHLLGQPNLLREWTCLLPSSRRRRSTSLRCSCFFAPVLECLTFFLLPACGIQAVKPDQAMPSPSNQLTATKASGCSLHARTSASLRLSSACPLSSKQLASQSMKKAGSYTSS